MPAKATFLMHSLVANHAFIDGNKRVGAHAALLFAVVNEHRCLIRPAEPTETSVAVARGELDAESLTIWFRRRLREPDV